MDQTSLKRYNYGTNINKKDIHSYGSNVIKKI